MDAFRVMRQLGTTLGLAHLRQQAHDPLPGERITLAEHTLQRNARSATMKRSTGSGVYLFSTHAQGECLEPPRLRGNPISTLLGIYAFALLGVLLGVT